jgi:2,4-dienoyl-CoA reductase-like NADH-dependent reductase (Old Yellow Enzyme family)
MWVGFLILLLHPEDGLPVAPSAIAPTGQVYTASWQLADYETPRELPVSEIPALLQAYRHAATMAKQAGFDGVEIHRPTVIYWISFYKTPAINAKINMAAALPIERACC